MLLDITDCLTAPAAVLTPYAPTTVGTHTNTAPYIDRMVLMDDGTGADVTFIVYVSTTATSNGSATVQFKLLGNATDITFASGNVVLADSGAIAVATLVAGYRFVAKIPRQNFASVEPTTAYYRYLALSVVIGTADLTAGAFNAWISNDGIQDNNSYKAGYTV